VPYAFAAHDLKHGNAEDLEVEDERPTLQVSSSRDDNCRSGVPLLLRARGVDRLDVEVTLMRQALHPGVVMQKTESMRCRCPAPRPRLIARPTHDPCNNANQCVTPSLRATLNAVITSILRSKLRDCRLKYSASRRTFSDIGSSSRPFTCAQPVIPGTSS